MNRTPIAGPSSDGTADSPLDVALSERDRDVLRMVADALDHGRTLLAYQPVVQTARPERPAFWEGLIRILDIQGRVVPARDFMAQVEAHELGRRIDLVALQHGLKALAEVSGLRLSINMSARSIGYGPWLTALRRGLDAEPTVAERLILEITERSAIVVPEHVQAFMAEFQARGVSFAIDDFGAGFTALRYLRDFCFDILKIDGQFVRGVHASPDDQVMIRALLALARHFDMFTVAEYVETAEDARFLASVGVDCMQGHYFAPPTVRPNWSQDREKRRAG